MIYFNDKKEAFGSEISNYIATIDDETWAQYSGYEAGTVWDVIDNKFEVLKTEEEIKVELEHKRIQGLFMTKLDLQTALKSIEDDTYKYYKQLKAILAQDEEMQDYWDDCVHVYRKPIGKENMLDELGKNLKPILTSAEIDKLFVNVDKAKQAVIT